MIYFIMLFLLIVIILVLFLEKNLINPIILFSAIWLLTIFLTSLKMYNMIDYSEKALRIISEGIIAFIIGAFFIMLIIHKKRKIQNVDEIDNKECEDNEIINNKILIILINIALIMVILLSIKVLSLLKSRCKL